MVFTSVEYFTDFGILFASSGMPLEHTQELEMLFLAVIASAHALEPSFFVGGFGAVNQEGWVAEYAAVGVTMVIPVRGAVSFSPLVGLDYSPRLGNWGALAGGVVDYAATERWGIDALTFGQLDHDPWLGGWTCYGAAGLGASYFASPQLVVSGSLTRVWNFEGHYNPSWSPSLLFTFTPQWR